MRALAVVESDLYAVLREGLNLEGELDYASEWSNASSLLLKKRFDYVFISARGWSQNTDMLWPIASQLRLLKVDALFIGLHTEALEVLNKFYVGFSHIDYDQAPSEFIQQLQIKCPRFFLPDILERELSLDFDSFVEKMNHNTSAMRLNSQLGTDYDFVKKARPAEARQSSEAMMKAFNSSIWGSVDDNEKASEFSDLFLNSDSHDRVVKVDQATEFDHFLNPHTAASQKTKKQIHYQFSDYLNRTVTPYFVPRLLIMMTRFKATGTLRLELENRPLVIQLRDGLYHKSLKDALILSAFSWRSGTTSFEPGDDLQFDSPRNFANLYDLVKEGMKLHIALNALMTELGKVLNQYPVLTNLFSTDREDSGEHGKWWKKCDGQHKLLDIISSGGSLDEGLCREVYFAWLADEIFYSPEPFDGTVEVHFSPSPSVASIFTSKAEKTQQRIPISSINMENVERKNDSAQEIEILNQLKRLDQQLQNDMYHEALEVKPLSGIRKLEEAYYAWIRNYHADRFAKYKNKEIHRLSNDLLIQMNSKFPKFLKMEREAIERENTRYELNSKTDEKTSNQDSSHGKTKLDAVRKRVDSQNEQTKLDNLLSNFANKNYKLSDVLARNRERTQTHKDLPSIEFENYDPRKILEEVYKKINQSRLHEAYRMLLALKEEDATCETKSISLWLRTIMEPEAKEDCIEKLKRKIKEEERVEMFWPTFYLGRIYFDEEEFEKALEVFAKARKINPKHVEAQRYERLATSRLDKASESQRGIFSKWIGKLRN